jgi:AraC family transcriptional regulator
LAELQSTQVLAETPLLRAYQVICREPASRLGEAMLNPVAQIGLPRRGLFLMKVRGQEVVVDPNTALVLGTEDEYRVGHPIAGGDEGLVLVLPPQLIEDAIGTAGACVGSLTPRHRVAISLLARTLRDGQPDQLEVEEMTFLLLSLLSQAFGHSLGGNGLGPAQRRRVELVRAMLASSPTTRWDLGRISREVHCSPFHLARQFRAATGGTIWEYILRLRLAIAIDRLAEGERNIAALALETGFAHHSHFSARFRSVVGTTPSQARNLLAAPNLESLRLLAGTCGSGGS